MSLWSGWATTARGALGTAVRAGVCVPVREHTFATDGTEQYGCAVGVGRTVGAGRTVGVWVVLGQGGAVEPGRMGDVTGGRRSISVTAASVRGMA